MKNIQMTRKPLARWIAFALATTTVVGIVQAATPLAGTEIKNLATVSYEDENGNRYTAQSNEAVITVAPQYRATLENDKELTAAPGQTVYFSHTLVNTGNVEDTYALATTAVDNAGANVNSSVKIFNDTNSNGQPDAGESEISALTLVAGETANIVVSYSIPSSATNDNTAEIVLTATSAKTGAIVEDIGDNKDNEPTGETTDANGNTVPSGDNEATNHDKVTVGSGPILVLNKESVINEANNTIIYTLTVKNTGSSVATNVDILDSLPKVDSNGDGVLDAQMTLVASSIKTNGLLDTGDTVAVETDETGLGVDIDGDGNTDATKVIHAMDAELAPNTTVSVEYTVSYDNKWAAGASIDNTFIAFEDPDGDNLPPAGKNPAKSNKTHDEVPQNYGVLATDDGTTNAVSPKINDGHDDNPDTNTDGTGDDDTQYVDSISSGDTVVFTHTITNTGNGDDKFNLSVKNTDFPSGTVFTFWNADGSVQLTDSDGDNVPDTGVLAQNESKVIVVKADLPSGVSKIGTSSFATLTAISSADPAVSTVKKSDTTELMLGEITAPAVDLSALGATQPNDGFNDAGVKNAHNEGPVFLKEGVIGGTVVFPMSVANEAGSPDSFLLSYDKLPEGWSVVFKDRSTGIGQGDTITSTPFIPAGGTFNYDAIVTISSIPAKALGNSDRADDVDGHDITNTSDNNAAYSVSTDLTADDGDKDYVIEFMVTSAVDAVRKDKIAHAIDVKDAKSVEITPDGQNQIQPGGTVDYPHKLINEGNIDEAVELNVANNDPDWNSRTLIKLKSGDLVELTNLKAGDIIIVNNPDATTEEVTLTDTDSDGKVEFPLRPGQFVNVTEKVFAPSDAAQGEVNTTTLTVRDPNETMRSMAKDNSNVILGQVRLTKTVALDANCDNTADGAYAEIQTAKVEPGQCAIWKILAKNEGDTLVKNVIVNDSIPAYTQYLANSLRIEGVNTNPTDKAGDDAAEYSQTANKVTYYLGTGADVANSKGGELKSGASTVVRFTVRVEE